MVNPAGNPLSKHFRQPTIYLKLPSGGKYYPDGALNLPVNGQIPIYPMTVKDELVIKTPDALMSGQGIVEMIKSCCPNIIDPWVMPSIDLDPVFIAIRLASYGAGMDIISTCPNCQNRNEYTIDLRKILDGIQTINFGEPITIDGMVFKFKPQEYQNLNHSNIIAFEEKKLAEFIVNNEDMPQEEKIRLFTESFEKIRRMNVKNVAVSIDNITTEDGVIVNNLEQITEFLEETGRLVYTQVQTEVQTLVNKHKIKDIAVTCENDACLKEYATAITFDQSNFFG